MRRGVLLGLAAVVGIAVLLQFVPYGRSQTNPPVRLEPAWDSAMTQALVERACSDCHSNQTKWPWYGRIAPVSWLVQRDVSEGRHELNFSEWDRPQEGDEAAKSVRSGEMPPSYYTILHPEARLSAAERQALVRGLEVTLGQSTVNDED